MKDKTRASKILAALAPPEWKRPKLTKKAIKKILEYYDLHAKLDIKILKRITYSDRNRFYNSKEWRALRLQTLNLYGYVCHACGATERINVDHIKPRSKYPDLSLSFDNLQILCWPCNKAKCTRNEIDYRNTGIVRSISDPQINSQ